MSRIDKPEPWSDQAPAHERVAFLADQRGKRGARLLKEAAGIAEQGNYAWAAAKARDGVEDCEKAAKMKSEARDAELAAGLVDFLATHPRIQFERFGDEFVAVGGGRAGRGRTLPQALIALAAVLSKRDANGQANGDECDAEFEAEHGSRS